MRGGQDHILVGSRAHVTADLYGNDNPPSLLTELEAAIQGGSSQKRTEMLRRITDLFVETAPRVTDERTGVFDDVLEQLIREIEWKAVLELSERMAAVENAPDRLIRRLAHDDSI